MMFDSSYYPTDDIIKLHTAEHTSTKPEATSAFYDVLPVVCSFIMSENLPDHNNSRYLKI